MERLFDRHGTEHTGPTAVANGHPAFSRLKRCGRCGGRGGSDAWKMTGWTCYDCGGKGNLGYEAVRLYTEAELTKLNATRDKRRAKKEAARVAKNVAIETEKKAAAEVFEAANAELVAAARELADKSPFLTDLVSKLPWSDKQLAAVAKTVADITERAKLRAGSGFVGTVGKRFETKVTVERIASYRRAAFGGYGEETVWIVSMRDAAGNAIVVKSPSFYGHEKGDSFTMRATVKEHSEYNGEKQTVVMRAKVLEEEKTE